MKIESLRYTPRQVAAFESAGYWTTATTNEALDRLSTERPHQRAVADGRVELTWLELRERARRLASLFIKLGLSAEDVIAIQLPNWSEFVVVVNAAMMAGVPFCQVHSDFRAREIEFVLGYTQAAAFVAPKKFRNFDYLAMIDQLRPRLPRLRHVFAVGEQIRRESFDLRRYLDASGALEVPARDLDSRRPVGNDLLRVAFTSGSTGDPKAVLHLHNTTHCSVRFINRDHRITPADVILAFLPVGLNWGLTNTLQAVTSGASLILLDHFTAPTALELIEKHAVTYVCCAPAHLVSMLRCPDIDSRNLSSLRVVVTGGASCPIEVIQDFRKRVSAALLELYGMLECGLQSCTLIDDDPAVVAGTVGRPIAEVSSKIVDDRGQICDVGQVGEILTRGPSVTVGYYNNPDANSRAFDWEGWFHTGDLGVFDRAGYLRIVGRKKEMIIRGGANIYPREIEEVLYQHPNVRDAAVIGLPDPRLGERTCACIVTRSGAPVTLAEIVAFLSPKIATYKLPEFLECFADLPRTPTGKIQKSLLRELVVTKHHAAGLQSQGTP